MLSDLIPQAYLAIPIRCCVVSAPGVGIWEIAEVRRVIPGELVCRHTLTHHLQPVFVMEQASLQGQHEDARDDRSCHSSMLAGGPERRGGGGTRDEKCWRGFLGGKRRRTVWRETVDIFLLGEMIKKTTPFTAWYTSVMCQGQNPFPNHCLFPGPLLLFILSTTSFPSVPFYFILPWMIRTYTATQLSLFPFR